MSALNYIVIIEDDTFFAKAFIQKISKLGEYQIKQYVSVENSLDDLLTLQPEIIFLDHNLEGINGVEAIPLLKEICPNSEIVVISSQLDIEVVKQADEYGATKYIRKDALLMNSTEEFINLYLEKPTNFQSFWLNLFKSN